MYESEKDKGVFNEDDCIVKHVPHQAITFFQDSYCSDLHVDNAFRHEIGVPEGIYPDLWLDLGKDEDDYEEDDEEDDYDDKSR